MANIVGIVTPKEVQTGLTLRARVTSPNGRYSAYQDFKCMIKKSGLTDEQSVITDLNTVSTKLLTNGATGIKNNLTAYMPATGEHQTSITYNVGGNGDINKYLANDGIVLKRPAYGEDAIVGTLTVTVKKNSAIAEREITITIEPYTSDELMQEVLNIIKWDNIRGNNATETKDNATNGMFNVMYPLNLMKTITTDIVSKPITVKWAVTQDITQSVLEDYRIDIETGKVLRPFYTSIHEQKDIKISSSMLDVITSKEELASGGTYLRIGGLTLTASIAIDGIDEAQSISFKLKTLSSALTDEEVQLYIEKNISLFKIYDTVYNTEFSLNTMSDATEHNVYYDTTGENASSLKLYTVNDIANITKNNELTNEPIKISAITWTVINPNSLADGGDGAPFVNGGSSNITVGAMPTPGGTLTLNPSIDPANNNIEKFVLRAVFNITNYAGASTMFIKIFYRFTLNNATPKENPSEQPVN